MVNLVDTFTRINGVPPTMKEADKLAELAKDPAKLEALKNKIIEKQAPKEEHVPKQRRRHAVPRRMPKDARIINRLLLLDIDKCIIAYAMDMPIGSVQHYCEEWKLPRKEK